MRNIILPAALAAAMALAPIASASPGASPSAQSQPATHVAKLTGKIHSVDAKARTLTLDDGRTFVLPAGYSGPGLKAGEKVTVHWAWTGDQRVAKEVQLRN